MSPRIRNVLLASTALFAFAPAPGTAGPDGPTVVGGAATVSGVGTATVNINQSSNRAIVNWNSFNLGAGESALFSQPSSSSVILNRVTGGLGPSEIFGTLNANGRVFLINRDGILFGPSATINTAGFLASTSDIKNKDFMAGRFYFNRPGAPDASIVNLGHITATQGGFAALVAPGVRNSGTITATLGTVSLASGNMFTLDMYGDRLIQLGVNDAIAGAVKDVATGETLKSLVTNDGKLKANGGRIELTAAAARTIVDSVINNTGVLEANTIGTKNGMIVLGAATEASKPAGAPVQTVKVAGKISAAGKKPGTSGGTVVVTGENIQVAGARINASGPAGGGKVLIGGDWGGGKPTTGLVQNASAKLENFAIPTATTVSVDAATKINASAREAGNGGKVVLWSDTMTTFAGVITARGGAQGGDGGFVEVSSRGQLNYAGTVDTRAPAGTTGTLLLDPADYYVVATLGFSPTGASEITSTALQGQLATSNVTIATNNTANPSGQNGDIFVNTSVSWASNNALTLSAYRNIVVFGGNNPLLILPATITNTASGSLVLRADSTGTGTGTVIFAAGFCGIDCLSPHGGVDFSGSTGAVSIYYNPTGNSDHVKYALPTDFSYRVAGAYTAYMLVNTADDLHLIGSKATTLGGTYALGKNIDASGFPLQGFSPATTFTGMFDGNGGLGVNYAISNLKLSSTSGPNLGLFPTIGANGTVRNLALTNVTVTSGVEYQVIGALAGENQGTITNVSVSGTVRGADPSLTAGGLVGINSGLIKGSSSAADVSIGTGSGGASNFYRDAHAGGLVGVNYDRIQQSSASGNVTGGGNTIIGGLVGSNGTDSESPGTITKSYATGAVRSEVTSTSYAAHAGGLVGANWGDITFSYASGDVSSAGPVKIANIGGLVGQQMGGSTIALSYASGNVSISNTLSSNSDGSAAGGLAGTAQQESVITDSYALGNVTVGTTLAGYNIRAGGFVGDNLGDVTRGYSTGAVNKSDNVGAYLLGGFFGQTDSGTVVNSFWDKGTSGQTNAYGNGSYPGVTGLTTAQAHTQACFTGSTCGGAPSGPDSFNFSNTEGDWFMVDGQTRPFLRSEFSTTITNSHQLQLVAMHPSFAYTLANNIDLAPDLSNASSMWGSGGFAPIASNFIGLFDGQQHTISNLTVTSPASSVGLFGTIGSGGGVSNLSLSNVTINATGASALVGPLAGSSNGSITNVSVNGTVKISGTGAITQGLPITADNLVLLGSGANYTLTNTGNQIGMLAANTGSLSLANARALTIGTVGSTTGVTATGTVAITDNTGISIAQAINAGTLTLSSTGPVTQSAAITASNLALLGAGGSYTLTNNGNQIGTLAANTGSVSLSNGHTLNIASAAGTTGVATTGAFTLNANGNTITATSPVSVGGVFTLAGGNWTQNDPNLPAFSATDFRITGGSFLRVTGGDGSTANPYQLADVYGLQGVTASVTAAGLLGKSYVLAGDIDASGTANWNAGGGFHGGGTLTGSLDGQSHTISRLTISGSTANPIGLFGFIGAGASVQNLTLANVAISGNTNVTNIGSLAGTNNGTITDVSVSGTVSGGAHSGVTAGGLVAQNRGIITGATSSVTVTVGDATSFASINAAGGLVGTNLGTITTSSASGAVSGGSDSYVGGLVGQNGLNGFGDGHITSSFATGAVNITGSAATGGGLVGQQSSPNSTIANSYATGNVNANGLEISSVGGLVGSNTGTITDSQALGSVTVTATTLTGVDGGVGGLVGSNNGGVITGSSTPGLAASCTAGAAFSCAAGNVSLSGPGAVGGLVGFNSTLFSSSTATISNALATGSVSGDPTGTTISTVGGLVGLNLAGNIANSHATGAVAGSGASDLGGLVGENLGLFSGTFVGSTITNSYATGTVTAGSGFATAGGLVGSNFGGTITSSSATGAVTVGDSATAGGLVGTNVPGATTLDNITFTLVGGAITNSSASGAVTGGIDSIIGGLAGINIGTITSSTASGKVTGGNDSLVGGLVGFNDSLGLDITALSLGVISSSSATGAVTGGKGSVAGGLVGINLGSVDTSTASGAVTAGDNSVAGGLLGVNGGGSFTIDGATVAFSGGSVTHSSASGAVTVGDHSNAGGLVGANGGTTAGALADLQTQYTLTGGAISDSFATGNVTGGSQSFLGGFVGLDVGDGTATNTITNAHAAGNVAGGASSIAGGFFGVNVFGAITQSYATGNVNAGAGSTVGGFGGLNIGTVSIASSSGTVTGGNSSFVGGFVGVNFAAVDPAVTFTTGAISQAYTTGSATGGTNSFVAGFAAVNVGSLSQTYAAGLVTAGAGSTTGGLVASNTFSYTLPASIALIDPPGSVTDSYWDVQTTGQTASAGGTGFVTGQLASGLPAGFDPSAWGAANGQYPFLAALGNLGTTPGTPVLPAPPPQVQPVPDVPQVPQIPQVTDVPQVTQVPTVLPVIPVLPPTTITTTVSTTTDATVASTELLITVPSSQQVVQQFNQGPPGPAVGGLAPVVDTRPILAQQAAPAQGQPPAATAVPTPGFSAPPIRLDVGEGRYFYLPPLGETRLVKNEVVLQLPCNVDRDALDAATRALRLTIISSQCLGSGQAVYRVEIRSGQSQQQVIRALAAYRIIVAAQANYLYALAQDGPTPSSLPPTPARPQGDPDQYVVEKLHLGEVHRLVTGAGVPVAVIDSEIDNVHPDLAGAISNRYDATGSEEKPHPHGTGMAGAIGSHQRLLGVAPGARLIAIHAFSTKAASPESTTFNILKGLDYAAANNARVVNMSFAGPPDPSLDRAVKAASDKGLILIAAAGNAGPKSPPLYPAANPSVIAVTATDTDDKIYSGAVRGKHVAIAAPGVDILVPAPDGTYQLTTGTSVATAHVSGVVALLLERNPKLTAADIRRILTQSAKRLGPPTDYGAGLIDPLKALDLAAPKSASVPPAAPAPATLAAATTSPARR